jgi:hypothetical protein
MKAAVCKWVLAIAASGAAALAQTYTLVGTTSSGAGILAGGNYSLDGEISHFNPNILTAGLYRLETGMAGDPPGVEPMDVELLVSHSNGRLTLLWDRTATGFVLEAATTLGSGAQWSEVNAPLELNATHTFVSIPAPAEDQFFRLRRR